MRLEFCDCRQVPIAYDNFIWFKPADFGQRAFSISAPITSLWCDRGFFYPWKVVEKIFLKNLKKTSYKSKKISQLVSEGKNLTNLENRIDIQQVHSWSGAKAPAEWRCATNFLPTGVITESKVGSDSEPFWNIRLLRIRRWNDSGTMILPYGAGGVPGRGEIPMSSVSSRTPVDFLLRIWGMRSS
mgnify:FL=1